MSVVFVRKAPADVIEELAARLAPRLQKAFLAAVENVKGSVGLEQLARAVQSGDVNRVLTYLSLDQRFVTALAGEGGIVEVSRAIFEQGAKAATTLLPQKIRDNIAFDVKNPEAVKFLNRYTMELIRETTKETKEAIKQVVTRAFQEGGHPLQQARTIKDTIGLTARQEQAVANYRSSLQSGQAANLRQALSRSLRDARSDAAVRRAIQSGQGLSQLQIDRLVQRYRERYIKYRAETIARTESLRTAVAGQKELWRQAKEEKLIPKNTLYEWVASGDDATCSDCMSLDTEKREEGQEFVDGVTQPPFHPNCRCRLVLAL